MRLPRRWVLGLILAAAACKPPDLNQNWDVSTSPTPVFQREDPGLVVTEQLTFEHAIGRSPCPQMIGRITIRRVGGDPSARVRILSRHVGLEVPVDEVSVELGAEVTVDVFFNCNQRESFEGLVHVVEGDFLTGTIHRVPVYGALYR
jgi:hypothetical protein